MQSILKPKRLFGKPIWAGRLPISRVERRSNHALRRFIRIKDFRNQRREWFDSLEGQYQRLGLE